MIEDAAQDRRPHPRHGWLAAVIPEGAQRFRVGNRELATTLSVAGAQLVETQPDVEIGETGQLQGDAECAVVEVAMPAWPGHRRLFRGASRFVGSAEMSRRAARARATLRALGYSSTSVVTWERGVTLGHRRYSSVRRRLAHRFPLNAVVVGRRASSGQTQFDAALTAAEARLERPLRPEGLLFGASGVIIARGDRVVLRVAIGPAAGRIAEQYAALRALLESNPQPLVAERVPWMIAQDKTGLTMWSLERRLPGSVPGPRLTSPLVGDSLDFLQALHTIGRDGGESATNAERGDAIAQLCGDRVSSALREFGASLDDTLADVPRGFSHGDFWTGNLLMASDGLAGVVDWPGAEAGSLPVLDLLQLEVNSLRELHRLQLGPALMQGALPRMRAGGSELVRSYCRRLDLEFNADQREALLGAYWLQAMWHELFDPDRDPDQAADPSWRRQNVELVLEALRSKSPATRPLRSGADAVTVEVVSDTSALDAVVDEWRDLAVARANPFITPEWFFSWLRHEAGATQPFVPVVRRPDGRFLGLFPLVLTSKQRYAMLRFAGADVGDRFEPVGAENDEGVLGAAVARCLLRTSKEWAIFVADYAAEGAEWLQALVGLPDMASIQYHRRPSIYYSIPLVDQTWDTFLASMSRNLRGQIGRKLRLLERDHEVRFRRTQDEVELRSDIDRLFSLHHERWRNRGGTFLDDEGVREFQTDFAEACLKRDWLRLWSLEVDEEAIAVWYGWQMGGRYLYYQAGFDPAWSRFSPGLLLLTHTMRMAIEEGAREYDMLLGDEPYKSRFKTNVRSGQTIVVTRALHPSRALVAFDVGLRRAVRTLPADVHSVVRRVATPVLKRWPVKTTP